MKTILFAEDTIELQELMVGILESKGFKVITANNGLEALNIFTTTPVDIIITDLEMPIMNGVELVHKIRTLNSTIPIVMWSASENPNIKSLNLFSQKTSGKKDILNFLKEVA